MRHYNTVLLHLSISLKSLVYGFFMWLIYQSTVFSRNESFTSIDTVKYFGFRHTYCKIELSFYDWVIDSIPLVHLVLDKVILTVHFTDNVLSA